MSDDQMLWPLRDVSSDPTNLTKLDADNNVLTSTADVIAAVAAAGGGGGNFVSKTGDTMTGQLVVSPAAAPAAPDGSIQVIGDNTNASITVQRNSSDNLNGAFRLKKSRGTAAAPLSVAAGDFLGGLVFHATRNDNTYANAGAIQSYCTRTPAVGETFVPMELRFQITNTAATAALTALRLNDLGAEIAGNITSAGTAHNFAANSITASAISGLPEASAVAGTALAVAGAIGVSTAYARADHVHPLPSLKADDLTDVTVATPAAGQVLRWNGTAFVNVALGYADLIGAPTALAASTVAGAADSAAGAVGTSALYARADHSHPYPTPAQVGAVGKSGDTVTGNMVFQGTSNTFSQASINSTAIGPLVIDSRATTAYTLSLTDIGKVIYKTATANATLTLPTDAAAAIPVGSVVEIVNNAATGFFYVKADAGVSLFYNSTLGAGSDGSLGGGVAVQVRLRGPMTSARIMKQGANSWAIFGDLVTI